jgi:hypothetical protein
VPGTPVTTVAGEHQLFYLWVVVFNCFRELFPCANLSSAGGHIYHRCCDRDLFAAFDGAR